jgi:putative sterol carrier protein
VRVWLVHDDEVSTDAVAFLKQLGERGHEPLWAKVSGRVRFELVKGSRVDRWLVAVENGDVAVAHKGGEADCTVRADRALWDRLCRGEENAMAAMLRGVLQCAGDVDLLLALQRVFPGPPSTRSPAGSRVLDER